MSATAMAGDRVLDGAYPSEGELRPSEAHDFMSPSRPGPLLAIPKWLQSPRRRVRSGHRPSEMPCRDGGHERQVLGHLSLAAPVRIQSSVFSQRLHSLHGHLANSSVHPAFRSIENKFVNCTRDARMEGPPWLPVHHWVILTYTPITPRPLSTTDSVSSQLWGAGVHSLSSLPC